jgi:hypothetical protein
MALTACFASGHFPYNDAFLTYYRKSTKNPKSLTELTDLVIEVFDGTNLRPGTVVLLGSVSHLHRVGVSLYAKDWVTSVARLKKKWGGFRFVRSSP